MNGVGTFTCVHRGITFITSLNNDTTSRQQQRNIHLYFLYKENNNQYLIITSAVVMVHLSEVTADLMDQLMKVEIFHPLEKLRLLKDDKRTFLDPNVIMDERHRTLRENFYVPPAERSVLAEAKR